MVSCQCLTGSWAAMGKYKVGPSALATYALLESDINPQNPKMKKALTWLSRNRTVNTYGLGLRANVWLSANRHTSNKYRTFLMKDAKMLWLSAMNVQFRDVRYTVPFLTQFWMFMTPIAYPSSLIEQPWLRTLYGLNPITGVVEGFRCALLGTDTQPGLVIIASSAMSLLLLVSGAFYFRRMEKTFADVV